MPKKRESSSMEKLIFSILKTQEFPLNDGFFRDHALRSKKPRLMMKGPPPDVPEPGYAFLPDLVLIEIFKYLPVRERCQARRVCSNWNQILSSGTFLRHLEILELNSPEFLSVVHNLPEGVTKLRLKCKFQKIPISLSHILTKLSEQCPDVKDFTLEDISLLGDLNPFTPCLRRSARLDALDSARCSESELLYKNVLRCMNLESRREHEAFQNMVLRAMTTLSLKSVYLDASNLLPCIKPRFFPNVKVLDLSDSQPQNMDYAELFTDFVDLEELYLPKWTINDYSLTKFLKNVKKLKILDLEFTFVGKETISNLKKNGKSLEKLYVSHTCVESIYSDGEEEVFFPQLQELCIKHTTVTERDMTKVLSKCQCLRIVDVSRCRRISSRWVDGLSKRNKEIVICENVDVFNLYCCHNKNRGSSQPNHSL